MTAIIVGILSLIVALGAMGLSFFTYFAHDRELKKQEQKINGLQLSALRREEAETKKAKIRGNIIDVPDKGSRELRIFNAGQVTARNVKVEWVNSRENDGIYVSEDFSDLGDMSPQNTWKVRLTWEDDFQENNVFEEFLQI